MNKVNKNQKNIDNIFDEFNNEPQDKNKKKKIIEKSGLIERVDRIYVTEDGRQLLREQY